MNDDGIRVGELRNISNNFLEVAQIEILLGPCSLVERRCIDTDKDDA